MDYKRIKSLISNPGDKEYTRTSYAIYNEFGLIALVYADSEQDAIDYAADSGHLDGERMDPADHQEYESNGWDECFDLCQCHTRGLCTFNFGAVAMGE